MIKLNKAQQEAVDHIYGPLLVLAGPGTGKTQLLSARVANILQHDNSPSNILCLTFTDAAASNMRERLVGLIGQDAYKVHISTYHALGADIIKNHAEYFQKLAVNRSEDVLLERPIDELTQIQIIEQIVDDLDFNDPLIGSRYYVKSVLSTISDLKRANMTPDDLSTTAEHNQAQIDTAQTVIDRVVNSAGGFSRKKEQRSAQFDDLLESLSKLKGDLLEQAVTELSLAYVESSETSSSTPLTSWKTKWLPKNAEGNHTLTDQKHVGRLLSLSRIYSAYNQALSDRNLYDFDDMILRSIEALETSSELRFNLQEQYQYILLDEFQDTNASQFKLVELIASRDTDESPNIMAVGDDDQAIYAFQGAKSSNMLKYIHTYKNTRIIPLTTNYRSGKPILELAGALSEQIHTRLSDNLEYVSKDLTAGLKQPVQAPERTSYNTQIDEYAGVADSVSALINDGVSPEQIVVLSPRHRDLVAIAPYLHGLGIPIAYERQENVLESPHITHTVNVCRLLLAIREMGTVIINQLAPVVLSETYWGIPVDSIWHINWSCDRDSNWLELAIDEDDLATPVKFLLTLSSMIDSHSLEHMLDYLIGNQPIEIDGEKYTSPYKKHYLAPEAERSSPDMYYEIISSLSTIREAIRDRQTNTDRSLQIQDFIEITDMYRAADMRMTYKHAVESHPKSVQLMTVYKAKGLEFEHVFLINADEQTWGGGARGASNKLSLPPNLAHIRYTGADHDERLRILYVAVTRAKIGLHISSHRVNMTGKQTTSLSFLHGVLDESHKEETGSAVNAQESILYHWSNRHLQVSSSLLSLLAPRLAKYRLSPTHLNSFVDLEYGGPESFALNTLLRFPQAPSGPGEYGTSIHNALEWYQHRLSSGKPPTTDETIGYFVRDLGSRLLTAPELQRYTDQGTASLNSYLERAAKEWSDNAETEVNFYSHGVTVGPAVLSGKIDRMEIDHKQKTIKIADYKTGKPYRKWTRDLKLLKYEQQLYFYKILVEGSDKYRDYRLTEARLEFVEPDKDGRAVPPLVIEYDDKKEDEIKKLITVIWSMIMAYDLPEVDTYTRDLKGSLQFIEDLLTKS
ncbi:MAG: ATP-dependent DNA helicase [Patescibacteria group bacterium]